MVRHFIYLRCNNDFFNQRQLQVTITPSPVNDQTSDRQTSRLGVHSLPEVIRRSFANTFIPCVVSKVGCSSAPWRRVEAGVLQNLFTLVYPNHDLTITKGDALESTVCYAASGSLPAHTHISQFRRTQGSCRSGMPLQNGPRKTFKPIWNVSMFMIPKHMSHQHSPITKRSHSSIASSDRQISWSLTLKRNWGDSKLYVAFYHSPYNSLTYQPTDPSRTFSASSYPPDDVNILSTDQV